MDGRILVFEHPGAPDAGIQVPAGIIEPGEDPARAALREAAEESGLRGQTPDAVPQFNLPHAFVLNGHDLPVYLSLRRKLGVVDYDLRPYGRDETHRRHFFHLEMLGDLPESWTAWEEHPSDGSPWADRVSNVLGRPVRQSPAHLRRTGRASARVHLQVLWLVSSVTYSHAVSCTA